MMIFHSFLLTLTRGYNLHRTSPEKNPFLFLEPSLFLWNFLRIFLGFPSKTCRGNNCKSCVATSKRSALWRLIKLDQSEISWIMMDLCVYTYIYMIWYDIKWIWTGIQTLYIYYIIYIYIHYIYICMLYSYVFVQQRCAVHVYTVYTPKNINV